MQRSIENGRQQVGSRPDGLQPFADSRDRRSKAAAETARSAPTLQAAVQDRRSMQAVNDQNCNQAGHRGEQQPAAAARAIHPIHIRAGIGQAVGKYKQGEASEDRGRGEVAESLQKENSEHAGHRETFFAGQNQRPDGLAGSSQNKNRREAHQRPRVCVQKISGTDILAESLPADRADRITPVNPNEAKQKKKNIRLADAGDEFPPGEVGQMNLVAGVIGERHHARQNQQRDQYPTKSSTHSHARLTAAATGCQERTVRLCSKGCGFPNDRIECIVTEYSHKSAVLRGPDS